jgi:tetratricopeptide (TPR) repeat protein
MKYVAIAVVGLILFVAEVWHFSSSIQTPPPSSQNPPGNETNAVYRRRQSEAAKKQGDNYYDNGQYDYAVQSYRFGLNLDPSNAQLLQAFQRAQAAEVANRVQQFQSAKSQGDNYYDKGQYDKAINAYQEGLKLDPSNAQLIKALRRAQTAKATEEKFNH